MCNFISWIKKDNMVLFLTAQDIFRTKAGKELQKYCERKEDLIGHGAIREYYNFSGGKEFECTDFSNPDNFPNEIVQAIKDGKFRGLGTPLQCFTKPAQDEYNKITKSAWDEYSKVKKSAWDEYNKITKSAWDEYNKITKSARDEYRKTIKPAQDEYNKITKPAWDEYKKIKKSARDEYSKITKSTFWDLFSEPKNRIKCWR